MSFLYGSYPRVAVILAKAIAKIVKKITHKITIHVQKHYKKFTAPSNYAITKFTPSIISWIKDNINISLFVNMYCNVQHIKKQWQKCPQLKTHHSKIFKTPFWQEKNEKVPLPSNSFKMTSHSVTPVLQKCHHLS